ncbi:uncharacterized protein [Misgurnus anguillicaudatus]|uniref:uncharacterized protein n=1 Tax=Misgurnus anguillicaudatus TaxID=75329 RepID=UPI003CCF6A17
MMKKAQVGGKWLKERKVEIYFQTRTATRSHLNARKSLLPTLQLSHKCCSLGPQNLSSGVVSDVSVSLYEGDSVSLHTNTKTQKDHLIEWRFGKQQDLIARINGEPTSLKIYDDVLDGRFKDKLKVNTENGDLTITNITTNNNTGDYKLEISNRAITRETFIINVSGDKVTVIVGDSVITVKNVIKKPGDEKIMWRIRHNNSLVAEMNETVLTYNVNNERFRDRLQVNDQTGDLTITNIRPDDSGSYKVDITVGSHTHTIHRSFNVSVKDQSSGLSSGVIAGICVGVVLGVVAAAAAVGFIIYRKSFKANGNEREGVGPSINNEATGEESTEMNKPLRTGDHSSSDVP